MHIIHENLQAEAETAAKAISQEYGITTELYNMSLEGLFDPYPEGNGHLINEKRCILDLHDIISKGILILTPRDIYLLPENPEDTWLLGYRSDLALLWVISVARLQGSDNSPQQKLSVPIELYAKRLSFLTIHELGHSLVDDRHLKEATWINAKTGYGLHLGLHCTDNSCALYEIVDIHAPSPEEGYLLLGTEKRHDAGLDDVISRFASAHLCTTCSSSIKPAAQYLS